jgi:hypothetical protein
MVSAVEAGQGDFAAALKHGNGLVENVGVAAGVEHGGPFAALAGFCRGDFVSSRAVASGGIGFPDKWSRIAHGDDQPGGETADDAVADDQVRRGHARQGERVIGGGRE